MAERIIVGNLDCETDFAAASAGNPCPPALPRHVLENIAAASTLLRVFCEEGDLLWTPVEVDSGRLTGPPELARPALTSGPLAAVAEERAMLAWGETGAVAAARSERPPAHPFRVEAPLAENLWNLPTATPGAAAKINDKRFCQQLREKLGLALPASRIVESIEELEKHLDAEKNRPELAGGWILKAPFSAAGRLRVVSTGPGAGELELKRARNLFEAQGALVFEPWLERTADFGFCALVLSERTILLGPHGLETSPQGRFLGLVFDSPAPAVGLAAPADRDGLEAAVTAAAEAAREEGYLGPLEVDCWSWRDENGADRFHPLGEINARISFGLVGRAIIEKLSGSHGWLVKKPARLNIGAGQAPSEDLPSAELLSPEPPDGCGAWLQQIPAP
ncbi:MAG: hypothetical protein VX958_02590 [Planctomycetota bacterium]|nr:hypothetical protein [Planctomycetota bacterium]